jgi:GT2 family glycosyltransferase
MTEQAARGVGGGVTTPVPESSRTTPGTRPAVRGKFLWAGDEKLFVKGATYGAFEPDTDGNEYHDLSVVERDFELMADSGMNAVRIPHTMPPVELLDAAGRHGLRVMVGLSAEQYAGYLADRRRGRPDVERILREKVRACAGHPALLCYALGNEIPAPMVRWLGRRNVERYLERLYEVTKDEDPDSVVTYVNYPSTEYLELPFLDLLSFNVYLEDRERLEAYLARLHNLAGDRPLLMSEIGLDAFRNGEEAQAESLAWQIETAFGAGCAGAFAFSWTDEWFRGGEHVLDWEFGLTRRDRSPKPALAAVSRSFAEVPFPKSREWPSISVVVCTYNGSRHLPACLEAVRRLEYPSYEVIVVDDGSTDGSAPIAESYGVRVISVPNGGLSRARNIGAEAANGKIVAYLDDDAAPDPHWLQYLADTFVRTGCAAAGGPNIPPPGAGDVAECVARSPGGPVHVLVSDTEAEHVPGCNMAVRVSALEALGGFDPQFHVAGDDVDLCWRIRERGWTIAFNAAAAVWHRRRESVRAYLRQQRGYGRAEALLERKWPERYNGLGHVTWGGHVYGNGRAWALPFRRGRIYGGVWGLAPFQSLYQPAHGLLASLSRTPEWYFVIAGLGALSALGALWTPLLFVLPALALALLLPLYDAVDSAAAAHGRVRPRRRRTRLRILTGLLHIAQPLARLAGRLGFGLSPWRSRSPAGLVVPRPRAVAIWRETWRAQSEWLSSLEESARGSGLAVRRGGDFDRWDLEVRAGAVGGARLLFAAEDHGGGAQLLRVRTSPRWSRGALAAFAILLGAAAAAAAGAAWVPAGLLSGLALLVLLDTGYRCAVALAVVMQSLRILERDVVAEEDRSLSDVLVARTHAVADAEVS